MKTLLCRTVTAFSPREFDEKAVKTINAATDDGYKMNRMQFTTCAIPQNQGGGGVLSYSAFMVFEK